MVRVLVFVVAVLVAFLPARDAGAQGMDLSGAWSWINPGQGGPEQHTILLGRDGSFVHVARMPNGWMQRFVGGYRAGFTGSNQVELQVQIQDWNPKAMCTQIPSMGIRNCGQVPHPPGGTYRLTVLSPSQMLFQGATLSRDPNPFLLNANVPSQYVQNEAAPAQPTMPTLHPYDQSAVHRGNNDFIYGRLRGCNYKATGPNGTLYSGCDR